MLQGSVPVWAFYAILAYVLTFMLVMGALYLWRTIRRKERPPEKFKLLRGPGETLRRRVQKADENMSFYVFGGAFVPLLVAWSVLLLAVHLPKSLVLAGAGAALLLFGVTIIAAGVVLFRFLHRRRNDFLGYLGERAVAEYLEPLLAEGYRIFHDVPAEGRDKKFNLDHVAIGPAGVAIIETKTRRKKKGRVGYEAHVVTCDGRRLNWPWGEDSCGIDQVQAQAEWLAKWIEKRTAIRTNPKPIIAFPGWMVKERAITTFRVTSHKMLASIVTQWRPQRLTTDQVDLISRQLDERCRDVED